MRGPLALLRMLVLIVLFKPGLTIGGDEELGSLVSIGMIGCGKIGKTRFGT